MGQQHVRDATLEPIVFGAVAINTIIPPVKCVFESRDEIADFPRGVQLSNNRLMMKRREKMDLLKAMQSAVAYAQGLQEGRLSPYGPYIELHLANRN